MSTVESNVIRDTFTNAERLIGQASGNKPPIEVFGGRFPKNKMLVWNHETKKMEEIAVPPPSRLYKAAEVEDLNRLVNEFASRAKDAAERTFVWVSNGHVDVVLSETSDRLDRVVLQYKPTDAFKGLQEINGKVLNQKNLIEALRTKIDGEYSPANLLATVRKIKFKQDSSGSSEVGAGRASMGRSIESEVAGLTDPIPEDIAITVPVYDDLVNEYGGVHQAMIRCSLDVDPTEQSFRITAKAGEVSCALSDADRLIINRINAGVNKDRPAGATIAIFRGSGN